MTNMLKMGLLTLGVAAAFHSADSGAVVATYSSFSNAVNYCQAFTPGVSNTIRNRVIGSENVGTTPIAVACNFPLTQNGAAGNGNLKTIEVFFSNGAAADASVSCTLLTGTSAGIGAGPVYAVTKTATVSAGAANIIIWTQADNPTPSSPDFGSVLVGVNCNLPAQMTMSATIIQWAADNGL